MLIFIQNHEKWAYDGGVKTVFEVTLNSSPENFKKEKVGFQNDV